MKTTGQLFTILPIVLFSACGIVNDTVSPYEYEAHVKIEGDFAISQIKNYFYSKPFTENEYRQAKEARNRYDDKMRKMLNMRTRCYEPYIASLDNTPERVARRNAIRLYHSYCEEIDYLISMCKAKLDGSRYYYDTDRGLTLLQ